MTEFDADGNKSLNLSTRSLVQYRMLHQASNCLGFLYPLACICKWKSDLVIQLKLQTVESECSLTRFVCQMQSHMVYPVLFVVR